MGPGGAVDDQGAGTTGRHWLAPLVHTRPVGDTAYRWSRPSRENAGRDRTRVRRGHVSDPRPPSVAGGRATSPWSCWSVWWEDSASAASPRRGARNRPSRRSSPGPIRRICWYRSTAGSSVASGNPDYSPHLTQAIARLPGVLHVAPGLEVTGAPLTADGSPRIRVTGLAYPVASVNGLFFTQDRMAVYRGAPGVPAAARRDHDGAGGGQAPGLPRWPGDPFRVLLGRAAEPAGLRHQGGARPPCA